MKKTINFTGRIKIDAKSLRAVVDGQTNSLSDVEIAEDCLNKFSADARDIH